MATSSAGWRVGKLDVTNAAKTATPGTAALSRQYRVGKEQFVVETKAVGSLERLGLERLLRNEHYTMFILSRPCLATPAPTAERTL